MEGMDALCLMYDFFFFFYQEHNSRNFTLDREFQPVSLLGNIVLLSLCFEQTAASSEGISSISGSCEGKMECEINRQLLVQCQHCA